MGRFIQWLAVVLELGAAPTSTEIHEWRLGVSEGSLLKKLQAFRLCNASDKDVNVRYLSLAKDLSTDTGN